MFALWEKTEGRGGGGEKKGRLKTPRPFATANCPGKYYASLAGRKGDTQARFISELQPPIFREHPRSGRELAPPAKVWASHRQKLDDVSPAILHDNHTALARKALYRRASPSSRESSTMITIGDLRGWSRIAKSNRGNRDFIRSSQSRV